MYRLHTEYEGKTQYVHVVKKAGCKNTFNVEYDIVLKPTSGRAKKFMSEDAAKDFIESTFGYVADYLSQIKNIGKPSYYAYLFYTSYHIARDIAFLPFEIEAIHDTRKLSHDSLCKIACTFLRERNCAIVANQPATGYNGESPDAIGFHGARESHVVEVKTSHSDFISDKNKSFRANPQEGMGSLRWYMCEPYVIKLEEVPDNWGLVYVSKGIRSIVREAKPQERNMLAELDFLYNTARRGIGGRGDK